MIWAGDFNWHHPMWDEERNSHLFTTNNLDAAQILIDLLADFSMSLALPKDIPTLQVIHTKNLTQPNNIFCSSGILGIITQCMMLPDLQPPCIDHFPIATTLETSMEESPDTLKLNWWLVDWDKFWKHLTMLNKLPAPTEIRTLKVFDSSLTSVTTVINTAVAANIPCSNPSPFAKRWWTKELSQACSTMRCAARLANNVTNDLSHPSHWEYQLQCNTYTNLIQSTKKRNWTDWLEEADDISIWSINHPISGPSTDGGRTRIPWLKITTNNSNTQQVMDNQHKSKLLFMMFFPSQGVHLYQGTPERYPPPPKSSSLSQYPTSKSYR